jgi:hypothetical protein
MSDEITTLQKVRFRAFKLKGLPHAIEKFFKYFGYYLAICGLVTFSLFIMEEAFQTTMFSTWPAADAKEWRLVKHQIGVMEFINNRLKWTNKWFGWVQPFGWLAYDSYGIAGDEYVKGVSAKVFAHCPECFDGEEVEFTFHTQEMDVPKGEYYVWKSGTMRVMTRRVLEGAETYQVKGTVKWENGKAWIIWQD